MLKYCLLLELSICLQIIKYTSAVYLFLYRKRALILVYREYLVFPLYLAIFELTCLEIERPNGQPIEYKQNGIITLANLLDLIFFFLKVTRNNEHFPCSKQTMWKYQFLGIEESSLKYKTNKQKQNNRLSAHFFHLRKMENGETLVLFSFMFYFLCQNLPRFLPTH